jgi:transcriptional regulator with XRE-family HTH domain
MTFGKLFRHLRSKTGLGIKRLAPELGVSYTYLSKLENNELNPSEEFVQRAAKYFKTDRNHMLLSAGKIPPEVLKILREHPEDAVELLRARFGRRK